jgi:hypothetical protein
MRNITITEYEVGSDPRIVSWIPPETVIDFILAVLAPFEPVADIIVAQENVTEASDYMRGIAIGDIQ